MSNLLTAKQRRGHPRAQVQTLVRIAKRAISKADWLAQLHGESNGEFGAPEASDDVRALRAKAVKAVTEAVELNEAHNLGYPVSRSMLP